MPVAILPEITGALMQMLKNDPDVTALVGSRIAISLPEGRRAWNLKDVNAILIRLRGGTPPNIETEQRVSRADLNFYGAGNSPNIRRRVARQIWRTVEPVLCPPPGLRIPMGGPFPELGLYIKWIKPETSEPYVAPEPGTDIDRAVMPYLVCWSRIS